MAGKLQLDDFYRLRGQFLAIKSGSTRQAFFKLYDRLCEDTQFVSNQEKIQLLSALLISEFLSIAAEYHYASPEKTEGGWFGSDVFTLIKSFLNMTPQQALSNEFYLIDLWQLNAYLEKQQHNYYQRNLTIIQTILKTLDEKIERAVKPLLPLDNFILGISQEYNQSWHLFGNSERNLQNLFRQFILFTCRELYPVDEEFDKDLSMLHIPIDERPKQLNAYAMMRCICTGTILFNAMQTNGSGQAYKICMGRLGKEKIEDISNQEKAALLTLLALHIKTILSNHSALIMKWREISKQQIDENFSLFDYMQKMYIDIESKLKGIQLEEPETLVNNVKIGATDFLAKCSISTAIITLANEYIMPIIAKLAIKTPIVAAGYAVAGPAGAAIAGKLVDTVQQRVLPEVTAGLIAYRCVNIGKQYFTGHQFVDGLGESLCLSPQELAALAARVDAQKEETQQLEKLLQVLQAMPDEMVSPQKKAAIKLVLDKDQMDILANDWEQVAAHSQPRKH